MCEVLWLDPSQFQVLGKPKQINENQVVIELRSVGPKAICPSCKSVSTRVHNRYKRFLRDLPWVGYAVCIDLQARRFFCENPACAQKIFCERMGDLVAPWGRRTYRLIEAHLAIGLALGGAAGHRLSVLLQVTTSKDTLLRQIRKMAKRRLDRPRVLGVDDWAMRKGQTYGTILVDLERGQILDLLEDRQADTLAKWLADHPEIEIVARDRSPVYAEAIARVLPGAIQVADRWYLLKNLSDTVFKTLIQEENQIRPLLVPVSGAEIPQEKSAPTTEISLPPEQEPLTPAEERRKERIEKTLELAAQGWTQKQIAPHLGLNPKTVQRNLQAPSPRYSRHRRGQSLLNDFKPYLQKRWQAGCHNAAQLYREIREMGLYGRTTIVRDYLKPFRNWPAFSDVDGMTNPSAEPNGKKPSLRSITWFILKRETERKSENEELLEQLGENNQRLFKTIRLARAFATIVREQQAEKLEHWLEQAAASKIRLWKNFASRLRQDQAAVIAALSLDWSSGPTEGHINRLKCLKRQMYGRAKLDLLRLRLTAD